MERIHSLKISRAWDCIITGEILNAIFTLGNKPYCLRAVQLPVASKLFCVFSSNIRIFEKIPQDFSDTKISNLPENIFFFFIKIIKVYSMIEEGSIIFIVYCIFSLIRNKVTQIVNHLVGINFISDKQFIVLLRSTGQCAGSSPALSCSPVFLSSVLQNMNRPGKLIFNFGQSSFFSMFYVETFIIDIYFKKTF